MTLRFIGTTSDDGDCPTLYDIEGTDEILVQGERETEPEHLAQLRDVKETETFVRVPRSLLTRFAPRAMHRSFSRSHRSRISSRASGTPLGALRPALGTRPTATVPPPAVVARLWPNGLGLVRESTRSRTTIALSSAVRSAQGGTTADRERTPPEPSAARGYGFGHA